jgi:hypothetical protein
LQLLIICLRLKILIRNLEKRSPSLKGRGQGGAIKTNYHVKESFQNRVAQPGQE